MSHSLPQNFYRFSCIGYIGSATEQMKIGCEQREFFYITYELRIFIYGLLLREGACIRDIFQYTLLHGGLLEWWVEHERACVFVCKCWDGAWKDDITLLEWSILFLMKSVPNWMESVYRGLGLVAVAASFLYNQPFYISERWSSVKSNLHVVAYQRAHFYCRCCSDFVDILR